MFKINTYNISRQNISCSPKSSLSFASKPIYRLNVRRINPDGSYRHVPAIFSQLDVNTPEDKKAILNMSKQWKHSRLFNVITYDFMNQNSALGLNNKFYAVEFDNKKLPLKSRILSIAQVNLDLIGPENYYELEYIVSASDVFKNSPKKLVKGAGELLIYRILKHAKDNNKRGIALYSTFDVEGFYLKLGMNYDNHPELMTFPSGEDNWFLTRMENKYKFIPELK